MKPERGEIWRNIHTGRECIIKFRSFFNIAIDHVDDVVRLPVRYVHYKTFAKNFVRATPEIIGGKDERT